MEVLLLMLDIIATVVLVMWSARVEKRGQIDDRRPPRVGPGA